MSEYSSIQELAAIVVPKLTGAEFVAVQALFEDLPMMHPLWLFAQAMHDRASEMYPSFAAVGARVDAGDDPEDAEWGAAIDRDRDMFEVALPGVEKGAEA